jgi:hypothetical protein
MATTVPRHHLSALGDGPWLVNDQPRRVALMVTGISAGAVLFGAVGGATAMQPWCAVTFLIGGLVGVVRGVVAFVAALAPQEQYCPMCGTGMGLGTHRCRGCGFTELPPLQKGRVC